MGDETRHRVVVGVDGSTGSRTAVDFAAEAAVARQVPLHLVCGYINPAVMAPPMVAVYTPYIPDLGEPDLRVTEMLSQLAEDVRHDHPGLEVVDEVFERHPADLLVEESRNAGLLVIGARGHGGFVELLAGSVATQAVTHAHCPVVVVRGTPGRPGPVVAGVDASRQSDQVCAFAFAEADRRGRPLRLLHAWTAELNEIPDKAAVRDQAKLLLTGIQAHWSEKYPHVPVEGALIEADVVTALVDASENANMIVVGSHGHGRFASLLLGSTGYTLIHHARSPVAIVRPPVSGKA